MHIIAFDPSKHTGAFVANTCGVADCQKLTAKRGYCVAHYERLRRHGNPLGGSTGKGDLERFIEEVILPYEGDECIAWPYGRGGKGYAYMRADGVHLPAHRYICGIVNGPPPTAQHEVAHTCGGGFDACVNKNHLAWKTHSENEADKKVHGTSNIGERNGSAKLTEEQVRVILAQRGKESQQAIADQFGVSRSTVGNILSGKNWSWIQEVAQ